MARGSEAHKVRRFEILLYSILARARPAPLAELLKKLFRVRRRVVKAAHGCRFWIDPASHFGFHTLRDGVYERNQTELALRLLRPGDTFIDIGANEGYFSILASSAVGAGHVHCIEPQSRLQPIIGENISLNGAASVTVHRLALSDRAGPVHLHLTPWTNTGASSMFRHGGTGRARETVPAATLDGFFEENSLGAVRLVKMDCEGAEEMVVAGGGRTLGEKRIRFVYIEYHPVMIGEEACMRTHERMKDYGYVFTRITRLGLGVYHMPGYERALKPLGELRVNCGPPPGGPLT